MAANMLPPSNSNVSKRRRPTVSMLPSAERRWMFGEVSKLEVLIRDCWQANPKSRPSFKEIVHRLQAVERAGSKRGFGGESKRKKTLEVRTMLKAWQAWIKLTLVRTQRDVVRLCEALCSLLWRSRKRKDAKVRKATSAVNMQEAAADLLRDETVRISSADDHVLEKILSRASGVRGLSLLGRLMYPSKPGHRIAPEPLLRSDVIINTSTNEAMVRIRFAYLQEGERETQRKILTPVSLSRPVAPLTQDCGWSY